jgi:8-oxo-dGTP pyrophosphatase MutT (NUDIX family)
LVIETRPAATVVVARDTAEGFEVLLLQRTHSAVFMPGVFVFPGGAVDDDDRDPSLLARTGTMDDARASAMFVVATGRLPSLVAAIRACIEDLRLSLAETNWCRSVSAISVI